MSRMAGIRSLERHLLAWMLGALSLGAMLLVLASYLITLEEMGEVFDHNLQQVALAVSSQGTRQTDDRSTAARAVLPPVFDTHGDFDFSTAVWDRSGHRLFISDPAVPLPFVTRSGLSRIGEGAQAWHVYTLVGPDRIVQAAQRASSRSQLAVESASRLLLPLLALLLLTAALLVFALRRGLRPLDVAAADVAARSAASLEPIGTAQMPGEIHPLIHSINGLMQRLAEALTAQRQFVADAAHELRSPVTALRLQLQWLERANDEAERRQVIGELRLGIQRAQRLIEQLLDLSRVEPDAPSRPWQPLDLAALVRSTVLKRSIEADDKGVDIGAEPMCAVPLMADGHQLSVLLDNLVGNAIRYTPAGGRVDVGASLFDGRPMLRVIDSGPGIPAAERQRVFDRFHRGDAAPGPLGDVGSGLGLAIVRAIAERHGAEVSLQAGPQGRGLEARVVFGAERSGPAADAQAAVVPKSVPTP